MGNAFCSAVLNTLIALVNAIYDDARITFLGYTTKAAHAADQRRERTYRPLAAANFLFLVFTQIVIVALV